MCKMIFASVCLSLHLSVSNENVVILQYCIIIMLKDPSYHLYFVEVWFGMLCNFGWNKKISQ